MGRRRFAGNGGGAGRWRGILSGILQSGYSIGFLLASLAANSYCRLGVAADVLDRGTNPAFLALYIRTKVPESKHGSSIGGEHRASPSHRRAGVEALLLSCVLMFFMMFLSHGTQDLYPDFLKEVHKISDAMRAKYFDHREYRRRRWRNHLWAPVASGRPTKGMLAAWVCRSCSFRCGRLARARGNRPWPRF